MFKTAVKSFEILFRHFPFLCESSKMKLALIFLFSLATDDKEDDIVKKENIKEELEENRGVPKKEITKGIKKS